MSDSLSIASIAEEVAVQEGHVSYKLGDDVYVIKMLPGKQGMALAIRILKAIIPIAGLWVDGENKQGLILPEDDNLYTELALMFVSKLEEVNSAEVIAALCNGLTFNGDVVEFDSHFMCNYSSLLLVVEQAFKENFGTFLGEYLEAKGINLQQGLQDLKARMKMNTPEE